MEVFRIALLNRFLIFRRLMIARTLRVILGTYRSTTLRKLRPLAKRNLLLLTRLARRALILLTLLIRHRARTVVTRGNCLEESNPRRRVILISRNWRRRRRIVNRRTSLTVVVLLLTLRLLSSLSLLVLNLRRHTVRVISLLLVLLITLELARCRAKIPSRLISGRAFNLMRATLSPLLFLLFVVILRTLLMRISLNLR